MEELKSFVKSFFSDIENAEKEVDMALANPVIDGIVKALEPQITAILVAHGVPMDEIESVATKLLMLFNSVAAQVNSPSVTPVTSTSGG